MSVNKSSIYIFLFACFLFLLIAEANSQEKMDRVGDIPVYTFNEIEPMFHPEVSNDTTYVFNFWATYCAPCIKELPHFEAAGKKYAGEKIKIVLVSLDFKSRIQTGVIPFIKKRNISLPVIVLADPDANAWIDKVDPSWDGAIPATLIVKKGERAFYKKEFTYEELDLLITKFLEQ
ncbi:TlpA family protein disulfide reductase [Dysgonomonas sp. Marseille-P4677]|uniref:TlpA disulfide reductase family protein n=1 Tax=Dysgonomonas sp. Marseille-P4677 TaxID=2364790 RepID=UPI0019145063|nr:TlpA disulfide reductase family protein [Dysgonomonas sp. Marseille-P4677]MBK5722345.1 TlpA family protein disulfide reductase [Dysgonomonas sp. Marseille-P4677]